MNEYHSIYDPPKTPAIYVMYAGKKESHVAYVGLASKLQSRLYQHFVKRDSSVMSGGSATGLNPDYISKVIWWEHELFVDKDTRQAAELVAFGFFDPTLKSRGKPTKNAKKISNDPAFKKEMSQLFESEPNGVYYPQTLDNLHKRIIELEKRVSLLEK